MGDVSSREANDGMIDYAVEQCGKLDILVNNAGIMDGFEAIGDISDERWDKVFAVNVKGPMYAMRKAVQVMLGQESRGNIVNVASIGGTNGARAGAAYTASKHALIGMTENTGYMYAHEGIRCNAICPGGVETEIGGSMMADAGINQFGMGRSMAGLDKEIRMGKPEELAAAVLFVASDEASFMTGACVKVDGGVSVTSGRRFAPAHRRRKARDGHPPAARLLSLNVAPSPFALLNRDDARESPPHRN